MDSHIEAIDRKMSEAKSQSTNECYRLLKIKFKIIGVNKIVCNKKLMWLILI